MVAGAVTLICIWVGWIAHQARQQTAAVAQLRDLRATVGYDRRPEELYVPTWIRASLGDDYFINVVEVSLHDQRSGRQSVEFSTSQITQAVEAMSQLSRLRQISFNHTRIHDQQLTHFAPLASRIESLYFNESHNSNLTGDGIRHLASWPRLRELTIHSWFLDATHLKHLPNLPALKSFGWCGSLKAEAFEMIAKCDRLERLSLFSCSFKGSSLLQLRSAKRLKSVFLHNCTAEYSGSWLVKGDQVVEVDPTQKDYLFRPSGDRIPLHPPDTSFQEWLGQLLPGIEIQEFFSS